MISFSDAQKKLKEEARSRVLEEEWVPLARAAGRVLSAPVYGEEFVPSFDNSSMDGFALRTRELNPLETTLQVSARVIAGDQPSECLESHVAIEIMTGAPIPLGGFDAVVKVEDVQQHVSRDGVRSICFQSPLNPGQNLRYRGQDFKPGDLLAEKGVRVDAKLLMGFAALGVKKIPVMRMPKVWVLTTGNEIVEPEVEHLLPGEIRNATGPFLIEELKRLGCEVKYLGICKDEVQGLSAEYERALRQALHEGVDLFISTGAVSMGVHDFTEASIRALGGEIIFHRVNMRPGKPVLVARFKDYPRTLVMGLPGNPISTVLGLEFFAHPYLQQLQGVQVSDPIKAQLTKFVQKPAGLQCIYKARWFLSDEGRSSVEILGGQASFMIHSLSQANAWVILDEESQDISANTWVQVVPFRERMIGS